jgi:DNA replication protein DnaC
VRFLKNRQINLAYMKVVRNIARMTRRNALSVVQDRLSNFDSVAVLGPRGTGKTHAALALGLAACQKGQSVAFTTAAALVHDLMEARDERR